MEDEELPVFDPDTGLQAVDEEGNSVTRTVAMGRWSGGLYDEMSADGLSMDEIIHAGITALVKTAQGLAEAEKFWNERGIAAKAVASGNPAPPSTGANRAQKRAAAKTATKKQAAKKSTRKSSSRANTAGTTTPARARTAKTTPAAPTTTR